MEPNKYPYTGRENTNETSASQQSSHNTETLLDPNNLNPVNNSKTDSNSRAVVSSVTSVKDKSLNKKKVILLISIIFILIILSLGLLLYNDYSKKNTKTISSSSGSSASVSTSNVDTSSLNKLSTLSNPQIIYLNGGLYSISENGTGKKQLLSSSIVDGNTDFEISPNGKYIATPGTIITYNGASVTYSKRIVNTMFWSPDSQNLMYQWTKYPTSSGNQPTGSDYNPYICGAPDGSTPDNCQTYTEIFSIVTGKTTEINLPSDDRTSELLGWIDKNDLEFSDSDGSIDIYNLSSRSDSLVNVPSPSTTNGGGYANQTLNINYNGQKIFYTLTSFNGGGRTCDFYDVSSSWVLGSHIASIPDCVYNGSSWNGQGDMYYSFFNSSVSSDNENSLQVGGTLFNATNIYSYNFQTNKSSTVLESSNAHLYILDGVIAGNGILVSDINSNRAPKVIFEKVDLNGQNPVTLDEGQTNISYIGTIH